MNYLLDDNDALRMTPLGRSVLFHLHKPLAALRQTPSLFPHPLLLCTVQEGKQCHRLHSFSICFDL